MEIHSNIHRYMCSVLVFSNGKSSVHSSSHTWIGKSYYYYYRYMHGFSTRLQSRRRYLCLLFLYSKGFVG